MTSITLTWIAALSLPLLKSWQSYLSPFHATELAKSTLSNLLHEHIFYHFKKQVLSAHPVLHRYMNTQKAVNWTEKLHLAKRFSRKLEYISNYMYETFTLFIQSANVISISSYDESTSGLEPAMRKTEWVPI